MKKIFAILILFIFINGFSQKHELGVFLGGANAITDIGRTDYVNPLPLFFNDTSGDLKVPLALGLLYRFNLNPQQGLRFSLSYANLYGNDFSAVEDYRKKRGYRYSQNIYEASILYEYNFFPINTEQHRAYSPYIFAGVGAFAYTHLDYKVTHKFKSTGNPSTPKDFDTEISSSKRKKFNYTIPFGAGFKYRFRYNWIISAEVGVRPTLIDELDLSSAQPNDFSYVIETGLDSFPGVEEEIKNRNKNIITQRQVGDQSNNDWYVFTGLTLTYTFGRPACFCD